MHSSHLSHLMRGAIAVSLAMLIGAAAAVASADQPPNHFQLSSDGDELLYQGAPVRLHGIYFPNQPGVCNETLNGCRELGLGALFDWLADAGSVSCDVLSVTSQGIQVARCRQGEIDLGAWLIGHGYAVAEYRNYNRPFPRIPAVSGAKSSRRLTRV